MYRYRAQQHSLAFQVYAFASLAVFLGLMLIGQTAAAIVLALVNVGLLAYTRLRA